MRHKPSDTELFQIAFADWKEENGFGEFISPGDIDTTSLRQVLQRAQAMKMRAQEKSA